MAEWEDGAPVLPVQLSEGVTATRGGLWIRDGLPVATPDLFADYWWWPNDATSCISWADAAEHLQYQEGEPWCVDSERDNGLICDATTPAYHGTPSYLHRLAAILCDGADEFRVLHWCVHNFGSKD